ncbi:hypothetical protein VT52_020830 [Streptomyces malaysiense]|uniref:Uncharacterized protein n=2 Tax=Streptomyces malaysiense TaxID=1428626 RepID=A0A1J4Q0K5_9ACTN|nr:hypothetical protein VT52_020830 [Streptomyces malaysiense]
MLHRRTPETVTRVRADTASAQALPASPVPALAADASTARIPADPATSVRRAARNVRRGLKDRTARTGAAGRAPDWRQWADLARGYLALTLALVPRSRPRPTLTVFVAPLAERPVRRDPRDPGPRATF